MKRAWLQPFTWTVIVETTYFAALEAADRNNLRPLVEIWKQRLAAPEPPTA